MGLFIQVDYYVLFKLGLALVADPDLRGDGQNNEFKQIRGQSLDHCHPTLALLNGKDSSVNNGIRIIIKVVIATV